MSEVSVEVLRKRFPSEIINPYGEVLIVPSRLFQRGWESTLEAEGHRVYAGDYNGEASFLVRVEKAKPKNIENRPGDVVTRVTGPPLPRSDGYKRWTSEETLRLRDLLRQDLSVEEIAKELDRTTLSVQRKIQRLRTKDNLEAGSEPPKDPSSNPPITGEDHIKEFLAAASILYPKFPNACRFLLLETSKLLEV